MRTGLFGGAFNPFHNGHLQLLYSFLNYLDFDRVLLIPTANPPHKSGEGLIDGEKRLEMLSLIADENPKIFVSDIELKREGKSYSYLTVCELREMYPEDEFYLIIGSDQYLSFPSWYRAEELLKLVTVCACSRNEGEYEKLSDFREKNEIMKNTVICDFDVFEVSSTEIREKVKNGESIKGLVPDAVENYIKEHKLYV